MNVAQFLDQLREQQISLFTENGSLKYHAPQGALTTEFKQVIKDHRTDIIEYLTQTKDLIPASPSQRRMWVLHEIENPLAYNIRLQVRYNGPLDATRFKQCLDQLRNNHSILSTAFLMKFGQLWQRVNHEKPLPWLDLDFSNESDAETRSSKQISDFLMEPYDLTQAPLWRVIHIKTGDQSGRIGVGFHHSIMDGGSLGLFFKDLGELYTSGNTNQPSVEFDYSDYVRRMQDYLLSQDGKSDQKYWIETLSEVEPLSLPVDFQRPKVQSHTGKTRFFEIEKSAAEQLKQLGGRQGGTLYMVLCNLLTVLFYKFTGQTDIVLGVPVSGRDNAQTAGVYGLLLNTLPVRFRLNPDGNLEDSLNSVRQTLLEAYEHQHYPLDELINHLNLERDTSRNPLFDVSVVMQNAAEIDLDLGDVHIESEFTDSETAKGDLYIDFGETSSHLTMSVNYNTDLFLPDRIEQLGQQFRHLVNRFIDQADDPIRALPFPTDNYAVKAGPSSETGHNIWDLLNKAIKNADGDKSALEDAASTVSYDDFMDRVAVWQQHLTRSGIKAGDRVALALNRSVDLPLAILGIWSCNAVYVPIDLTFPDDRIRYMLTNAEVKTLLIDDEHADRGQNLVTSSDQRVNIIHPPSDSDRPTEKTSYSIDDLDQTAYIFHTSGSTGKPKGVPISHRSFSNFLSSMLHRPGMSPETRLLATTTISFDISMLELFLPVTAGGTIIIADDSGINDGHRLHELISVHNINTLQATPSSWRLLMEAGQELHDGFRALSGGEALPEDLAETIRSCTSELWNLYGPTEATIWASAEDCSLTVPAHHALTGIGSPLSNYTFAIWDEQRGFLPQGTDGELLIAGEALTPGYLNREDLNRSSFPELQDPVTGQTKRWYRTGDLARQHFDGRFYFMGRRDKQIKFRGFRIETGEIETAFRSIPDIQEAAVVLQQSHSADARLVAFIVSSNDQLNTDEIYRELEQQLPVYMMPTQIEPLSELPKTQNGKVDRNSLQKMNLSGAGRTNAVSEPLSTEMEYTVAEVWTEILGIEITDRRTNFFHHGGHSLKAMQVVDQLQDQLKTQIPLSQLFQHPVLCDFATWLNTHAEIEQEQQKASGNEASLSEEERALLGL